MTRICITGGPRTGKTTLARELAAQHPGTVVRHTDDLIEDYKHLGKEAWSAASQHVVDDWLTLPDPWVIEGVAVSRALRKWHEQHPGDPPPVDRVIYLTEPHESWTSRQRGMAAGVRKVHDEIEDWLAVFGVATEYR
jgi:broad-specificity NMP kinase